MPIKDVIVIGGSSGALEPLTKIVAGLPDELDVSVFVVIHVAVDSSMFYPEILARYTRWPVEVAAGGMPIRSRRIVLARPDHHLLIQPGRISTPRGPKENGFRPAVDPLFRTAAEVYGDRVAGVVLSGGLDDGAYGLLLIKTRGGFGVVQDPADAAVSSMPYNAIRAADPDLVLPSARIAGALIRTASDPTREGATVMREKKTTEERKQKDVSVRGDDALLTGALPGPPSGFTCPDCGGALWEVEDGELLRYRCHVGHGFNGASLLSRADDEMEAALWTALRMLEEGAAMRLRMAEKARKGKLEGLAIGYERRSAEIERQAEVIRRVLTSEDLRSDELPEHAEASVAPRKTLRANRK